MGGEGSLLNDIVLIARIMNLKDEGKSCMNLKNAIIISKNMDEYFRRSCWKEGRYYYIEHNALAESFDKKEHLMVMEHFEWRKDCFMNRLARDFDIDEVLANDWEIVRRNRIWG